MAKYSKFLKMRVSPEDIEIMIKKAETSLTPVRPVGIDGDTDKG